MPPNDWHVPYNVLAAALLKHIRTVRRRLHFVMRQVYIPLV